MQIHTSKFLAGMEETSCDRKEVMEELVGDTSNYVVTEGPFGRIRAKNENTICELTPSKLLDLTDHTNNTV